MGCRVSASEWQNRRREKERGVRLKKSERVRDNEGQKTNCLLSCTGHKLALAVMCGSEEVKRSCFGTTSPLPSQGD